MAKLSKMAQAKRKLKFPVRQYNRCPVCGLPIRPGNPIIVWPKSRANGKATHELCSLADYRNFIASAEDEYACSHGHGV